MNQRTKESLVSRYLYDAAGNRVMKRLHGDTVDYILRDGTGNELERITRRSNSTNPTLVKAEANLYGSSRLGVHEMPTTATPANREQRTSNTHTYELTDHLGNVRVTLGDRKTFTAVSGGYALSALVRSANDYYPFGMAINSRSFAAGSYRLGFNTQEKSKEISTNGDHTTALYWEYDSRLGRRWNLDPKPQIYLSDYSVNGLNPIRNFDWLGDKYSKKNERKAKRIDKKISNKITSLEKEKSKLIEKDQNTDHLNTRIGELKKSQDDIKDMREDQSTFYSFKRGNEAETKRTKSDEITIFSHSKGSLIHEIRHGGQLARKEYSIDETGKSSSTFGASKEVDAYRAQMGFDGTITYLPYIDFNDKEVTTKIFNGHKISIFQVTIRSFSEITKDLLPKMNEYKGIILKEKPYPDASNKDYYSK